MLFGGRTEITENLLTELEPKQRSKFVQLITDLFNKLKQKFSKNKGMLGEITRLENMFIETAKAVETKTTVDNSGGASWSLPKQLKNDSETLSISEQIKSSQERLNQMEPVAKVTVPQNLKTKYEAAEWAISELKSTGYHIDRQNFGIIYFEESDIRKGAEYADTNAEKAAFVLLPKVLKRGIEIGRHNNHKMRGKSTVTFAAPVIINGIRGNMAVVVNLRGNRYNVHRIMLPDGSVFKFSQKNKEVEQESYQGVAENSSLANTTSSTSKFSIPTTAENVNKNLSNQSDFKQRQLEIIKQTNPMWDDYHTGIRTANDIRTWEEVLALDDEREGQFVWGDFSREDAEQALKDGTITIYSSYPIENGVFVSTSYVQAQEYAGGRSGEVYSKTIPLTNVAWINGDEGQYAKVESVSYSLPDRDSAEALYDKIQRGEITKEQYLDEVSKTKQENPVTIAQMKKEEANTTPELREPKRVGTGDKESKLYDSLLESQIITDELKTEIANDTYIKNYGSTTNKRTLNMAVKELEEGGQTRVNEFVNLKPEKANAVDVAVGVILLERYQRAT